MKKLTATLLALTLILSLSACGNKENQSLEAPITETTAPFVDQTTGDSTDDTESIPNATVPEKAQTAIQETNPEATQPAETIPTETKPVETKPTETKPNEPTTPSTPSVTTPTEQNPTEPKPTEPQEPEGEHTHTTSKITKTYTYCTERGYEYHYCDCGFKMTFLHTAREHTLSQTVTVKPTREEGGVAEVKCGRCPYTTTETVPVLTAPYFVGFEVVSVERPNAYYLSNGQDFLSRLYGKNKAFQKGDSLVLKVIMSDGGSDFELDNYIPRCTCTKEGNLIYVSFDADYPSIMSEASVAIEAKNKDGEIERYSLIYHIFGSEDYLGGTVCGPELKAYGKRLGMQWVNNGTDFVEKYNGGYTWNDESLSLTGCTINGTDDLIPIQGNPDWVEEAIELLDAYAKMGFTRFSFSIYYSFTTLAE